MANASTDTIAGKARAGLSRKEALTQYHTLELPSPSEEHWRFTDISGFDPDAYAVAEAAEVARPDSMLDLDTAGTAFAGEGGIEIVQRARRCHVRAAPGSRAARVARWRQRTS